MNGNVCDVRGAWSGRILIPGQLAIRIARLAIDVMRNVYVAIYILLLIAVIVGVDVAFLKNMFWLRLAVNIGIVLVFAAVYFALLKDL